METTGHPGGPPSVERADWVALVDQVMRRAGRIEPDARPGAGVVALTRTTRDGIVVPPLFTAADAPRPADGPGVAPLVPGPAATGWDVRQRHADPDPEQTRAAVRDDLDNGVSSLWLTLGPGAIAVADLAGVLAHVDRDRVAVVLDTAGDPDPDTAQAAAAAFLALPAVSDTLLGTLGLDPIGLRVRHRADVPPDSVTPLALRVAAGHPRVRAVVVDALAVHEAGAADAQELGYSMAAAVAYLRALTAAGLDLAAAAGQLEFRYAATAQQFPTIAKLRAARLLWARVTQACGQRHQQRQHAAPSPAMLTVDDPHANLLRGTVAALAAGAGGADAVTVAPFDVVLGAPGAFSRRIARNTQSLLVQEAHLARVIDPAGGSWYVEALTRDLAAAAWSFFQEVEAAGGVVAALEGGLIAERIGAARERQEATR